jgi:protein TonB
VDRPAGRFARERRFGIGRQGAAIGRAVAGHVSVALAMMPVWGTKSPVSTGSPPPAVAVEIVPVFRSPVESFTEPRPDDAWSDVPAKASADDTVSPLPLARPKPALSKIVRDRIMQPRVEPRTRDVAPRDNATVEPVVDPAHATFGHSTVVTDVPSTWKSRLLAHLERFKRYPEMAKSRHEEGVSLLSFTLDREGRVLSFFVARSSGSDELDGAAQAMIERASPVPAIPDDVSGQTMQLVVPVRFTVR